MLEIGRLTRLELGYVGETDSRRVQIDVSEWLQRWPGAVIAVWVRKPEPDKTGYYANTEVEDGILTWVVTSGDVSQAGDGLAQIKALDPDGMGAIYKSRTVGTKIYASLEEMTSDPTAPDPMETWANKAAIYKEEAYRAKEEAIEASEAAKGSAESAMNSAEDARADADGAANSKEIAYKAAAAAADAADAANEAAKSVNDFKTEISDDIAAIFENVSQLSEENVALVEMKKYHHTDLPVGERLTIFSDDRYDAAPYVFFGKNFWPSTPFVAASQYIAYGMSFSTDEHNLTIKGAPTTGSSFRLVPKMGGERYWPIPEGLAPGDAVSLYLFADKYIEKRCPTINVRIYDEGKTQLLRINVSIGSGTTYAVTHQVIPDGAAYMEFEVPYSIGDGTEYDRTIHPVFVKRDTPIVSGLTFTGETCEVTLETTQDDVYTAPYISSIERAMTFSDYIAEYGVPAKAEKSPIVTPEMFGAYADGSHDDAAAIQACINYATANGKKVIGGGNYATNFPFVIKGNNNWVEIGQITYNGVDCAVIVSGSYNKLRFDRLYCPKGAGLRLRSDIVSSHNDIKIGYSMTKGTGVEYVITSESLVGNRLTFDRISVGDTNSNCISHTLSDDFPAGVNGGNNTYVGGRLDGGNWAVYGARPRDTFITLHMEDVKNGIYCDNASVVRIISPRWAELKNTAVDLNTPGYPRVPGKGVVVAMKQTQAALGKEGFLNAAFTVDGGDNFLIPQNIDLTEVLVEREAGASSAEAYSKNYPGASEVSTALRTRAGSIIAMRFLTFGRHILIKEPYTKRHKTISSVDNGYSGDYMKTDKDDEFFIYESFNIAESGCDYTLPPSYDWLAFDHFRVHQPEGTSCKFRDWRGTVVFDGATLGAGRYEVYARLYDDNEWDYYDNRNQAWDIYKDGELVATMPPTTV